MGDKLSGLEEVVVEAENNNHILGERPRKGIVKKRLYDLSNWAVDKYTKGVENRYGRFTLGYLMSIYLHALIPEHQREAARFLKMPDLSYFSKHGSTTIPSTISALEHFGLFVAAHHVTFYGNLDDFAFWANLSAGIGSTLWRQYMAFKDELESWQLTKWAAKPVREIGYGSGEYIGNTWVGKYRITRWAPRFLKYTFKKGSEPTPAIGWQFLTNEGVHLFGKGVVNGVKKLKEKREED